MPFLVFTNGTLIDCDTQPGSPRSATSRPRSRSKDSRNPLMPGGGRETSMRFWERCRSSETRGFRRVYR